MATAENVVPKSMPTAIGSDLLMITSDLCQALEGDITRIVAVDRRKESLPAKRNIRFDDH